MEQNMIRKALDMAGGAALIPEVVQPAIRDYLYKEPVLLNAVSKQPWATPTYYIRRRTALPTVTWTTDGANLPAAQNASYDKQQKSVAYVYAHGSVTGPMQKAAGSLYNALALEVEAATQAMAMNLSNKIAVGTGAANDIEGILHQIDTDASMNAGNGVIDHASDTDKTLSLAMIDEAIDLSNDEADMIVTSRKVRRAINSRLSALQRFNDKTDVAAGFRVISYDGLPIVTDFNWETDTDILLVRRSDCRFLVHEDVTYEELGKTKDATDFMLKGYFGFALEGRPVHVKGFTL